MYDFTKLAVIPFSGEDISNKEILTYTSASLAAMLSNPVGILFVERIAVTTAAANAVGGEVSSELGKLGLQKLRIEAKKAFRKALPEQIGQVYAAVAAKFGVKSGELLAVFPQGRTIFTQAPDDSLINPLTQLATSLTPYATPLGQPVVDQATGLKTTWEGLFSLASLAKQAKKGVAQSRQSLRAALEVELYKNLMWVCYNFPGDEAKLRLYCPQEGLFNRTAPTTPGATTLTLAGQEAQPRTARFTMTADGAESFRLLRRIAGEADLTVVAEDIMPVDGVATFSIYLEGTATYEFAAEAVRGTRTGERSAIVTVTAN